MANLRKLAKGRACLIRLPGVCNFNTETVVLCHISGGGMAGKRHDLFGAYGCSACHDEVDRRTRRITDKNLVRMWFLEGILRTQQMLIDEGVIGV